MKFYKRIIILITLLIVIQLKFSFSQEFVQSEKTSPNNKKHGFDTKRLFFGGGLGLQLGTETIIDLSPQVGYRFTDKFNLGIGISYLNYSYNQVPKFSTSIYGGNIFASYVLLENVFLRAEYELLSLESKVFNPYLSPDQQRFSVQSILVGGGYRYPIGARSYLNMMILWNLNETAYSPYSNPIIRMNFEF